MKKSSVLKIIFFLTGIFFIVTCFLFAGCDYNYTASQNFIQNTSTSVGSSRFFYVTKFSSDGTKETETFVTASSVVEKNNLAIFTENSLPASATDKAAEIAQIFEEHYDDMIDTYGQMTDVDKNDKLILLFYPMQTPQNGGAYIAGYFNSNDLYESSRSNGCELIYINSFLLGESFTIEDIMDTVFHEMQHAINASQQINNNKKTQLWLNEALSESSYFIYKNGAVNKDRLWSYNNDKNIKNGSYFYTWSSDISSYATASMFMYWLYVQGGGKDILKDIASSSSGSYEALTEAAKKAGIPATENWEELFSTWLEANFQNSSEGLYGYKGKIATDKIEARQAEAGTWRLNSYDAVYTATSFNPPESLKSKVMTKNGTIWRMVYNPNLAGSVSITLKPADVPESKTVSARSVGDGPLYIPTDRVFHERLSAE